MNFQKFKHDTKALSKDMTKLVMIVCIALAGTAALGMWGYEDGEIVIGDETDVPTGTIVDETGVPITTILSAKGQWKIKDALTNVETAAGDTGYVSILKAENGRFNPLNPAEKTELDASPDTGSATLKTGDELVIAVSSDNDPTSGAETYPRWFYVKSLSDGASIYSLNIYSPLSAISQSQTGDTYTFTVVESGLGKKIGEVTWLTGTTPYWDFGSFPVYGRVAKASMLAKISYAGVTGASVSDGATWIDTDAEITANFTATSDNFDLMFELQGEASDVAFGLPVLNVMSSGKIVQYDAVLIWGTDATTIDPSLLLEDGWHPINRAGLNEVVFYKVIDASKGGVPSTGNSISISAPITISDAALTASTEYEFEAWVLDVQNVENVKIGSTSASLPSVTAMGFISEFGLDTIVMPLALTGTTTLATPQLMGHFTTNA